jgi:hypothetical protein
MFTQTSDAACLDAFKGFACQGRTNGSQILVWIPGCIGFLLFLVVQGCSCHFDGHCIHFFLDLVRGLGRGRRSRVHVCVAAIPIVVQGGPDTLGWIVVEGLRQDVMACPTLDIFIGQGGVAQQDSIFAVVVRGQGREIGRACPHGLGRVNAVLGGAQDHELVVQQPFWLRGAKAPNGIHRLGGEEIQNELVTLGGSPCLSLGGKPLQLGIVLEGVRALVHDNGTHLALQGTHHTLVAEKVGTPKHTVGLVDFLAQVVHAMVKDDIMGGLGNGWSGSQPFGKGLGAYGKVGTHACKGGLHGPFDVPPVGRLTSGL